MNLIIWLKNRTNTGLKIGIYQVKKGKKVIKIGDGIGIARGAKNGVLGGAKFYFYEGAPVIDRWTAGPVRPWS